HAEDAEDRERDAPRPLVHPEQAKAERDARDREGHPAGLRGSEVLRGIGDGELVRIPETAARERRQREEEEGRRGERDRERGAPLSKVHGQSSARTRTNWWLASRVVTSRHAPTCASPFKLATRECSRTK